MNAEELSGLGKLSKEIEPLTGLKVKMHSLTAKEEEDVFAAMAGTPDDPLAKTSVMQIETLVRVIESIGTKVFTDVSELRAYLKALSRSVIAILWEAWMNEIENQALKQIQDLKKNSERPKAA